MTRSVYLGIIMMLVLTILQAALFGRFPAFDIILQPAIVVVLTWALLRGPYEGLIWAFIAGILLDIFSITPTGTTALALMVAVIVVVYLNQLFPENPYALPILLSGLGVGIYYLLYTIIIWIARFGFNEQLLASLPIAVLLHAILSLPIYWLLRTVERVLYPPPIEM